MPLYEYQCEACAHRFERIQKFADPPVETCPSCGGVVRKLVSSPAFHLKGSGWYVTDYARSGKTDQGDSEASKAGGAKSDKDAAASGDKAPEKTDKGDKKDTAGSAGKAAKSDEADKADKPASQSSKV